MAKILSILGPYPVSGYPTSHARDVDHRRRRGGCRDGYGGHAASRFASEPYDEALREQGARLATSAQQPLAGRTGVPDMRTLWIKLHYGPKARV
jgi:hypothetical protein